MAQIGAEIIFYLQISHCQNRLCIFLSHYFETHNLRHVIWASTCYIFDQTWIVVQTFIYDLFINVQESHAAFSTTANSGFRRIAKYHFVTRIKDLEFLNGEIHVSQP